MDSQILVLTFFTLRYRTRLAATEILFIGFSESIRDSNGVLGCVFRCGELAGLLKRIATYITNKNIVT